MNYCLKHVYTKYYTTLCEKHARHPIKFDLVWNGLAAYNKQWLNNIFVTRAIFLEILIKATHTKYTLQRFFKSKKPKDPCNKFDLSMVPIAHANPSLLFYVYENGKYYAFLICDMFNIIKQSLTHNIDMHANPKIIINPYTRTPFRHETLYLFFLKVYESHFLIPPLFFSFVKAGFSLSTFLMRNECVLRDYAIEATVDSFTSIFLHAEIRQMLQDVRVFDVTSAAYITIIPNVSLLPAKTMSYFKPWLHAYYIHNYSLSPMTRERSYKKLIKSIVLFRQENPEFGTKKNGIIHTTIVSPLKMSKLGH